MRLTRKEIEAYRKWQRKRRYRIPNAWINLALAIAFLVADLHFGLFPSEGNGSLLGLWLGFSVFWLISVYFDTSPEKKLFALLERYLNDDAQAIEQLANASHESAGDGDTNGQQKAALSIKD